MGLMGLDCGDEYLFIARQKLHQMRILWQQSFAQGVPLDDFQRERFQAALLPCLLHKVLRGDFVAGAQGLPDAEFGDVLQQGGGALVAEGEADGVHYGVVELVFQQGVAEVVHINQRGGGVGEGVLAQDLADFGQALVAQMAEKEQPVVVQGLRPVGEGVVDVVGMVQHQVAPQHFCAVFRQPEMKRLMVLRDLPFA